MASRRLTALAFLSLATFGAALSIAQDNVPTTPEEAVEWRIATMRENGSVLRGAGALTGDAAVAAMQTVKENFDSIPALFPEGSIVGESEALPAIWENWDAFTAIAQAGSDAAQAGIDAATAGDAAGYQQALQQIGATCGQCHQQFRG